MAPSRLASLGLVAFAVVPVRAAAETLTGTVTAHGARALEVPVVTADRHVCGQAGPVFGRGVRTGPGGGLLDAVVWLEGATAPPAPRHEVQLAQHNCGFEPRLVAAGVGSALRVRNHDPIFHTVTVEEVSSGRRVTSVGLLGAGAEATVWFADRPGHFRLRCADGHPWMTADLWVFDHPYFTTTSSVGRFDFPAVPEGNYEVRVEHPVLGGRRAAGRRVVAVEY